VKASYIPPHQERQEKIELLLKVQHWLEEEEVTEALPNQKK
jgi:hypothetical protein